MLRSGRLSVGIDPEALSEIALAVAEEAGAVALRGWRSRPRVTEKAPVDLVTDYDHASERLIRERLAILAPEIPVVGEEGGGAERPGPVFYCDPIDGTTNFAHGHFFWAVSIGVLSDGVPVAGAVVAPALGTSFRGHVGGGAWRNEAACHVSATDRLREALVATGFPPDRSRAPDNNFASFASVKQAVRAVRRCGSAALDCCLVADGTYDAYWERKLHVWDVAAGAAIVLGAGGRVTALDGGPPDLARGHVLLSNGRLHTALLPLISGPEAAPSIASASPDR